MLDLDKGPRGVVAAAPQGQELFARLQRHLRRGHEVGDLDPQLVRIGIEDLQWPLSSDRLSEAVLGLELDAIDPRRQLGGNLGVAAFRLHRLLQGHIAQLP